MDVDPVLLKQLGPPMRDREYWLTELGERHVYEMTIRELKARLMSALSPRANVGERGSDDHSSTRD